MIDYNTERDKLVMPEHGRHVQKMIEQAVAIEDPEKRKEQLQAVVNVMRSLEGISKDNPELIHKLWDHLQVISGFRLSQDDAPCPIPMMEDRKVAPNPIPRNRKPIRSTHYGRNIESMIDVIAGRPDGDDKVAMIRALAIYMRQQYLIWNKDNVSDETIFQDIFRMSEGRLVVPEGMVLTKISSDANFSRPGLNPVSGKFKNQNSRKKAMQQKRRNG